MSRDSFNPVRYAELHGLERRLNDKHRSHAGCLGGLFCWNLFLTLAVFALVFWR